MTTETQWAEYIPNGRKIFQMVINYVPIQTFFIPRPSKMHPNLEFWFANIPSGSPGTNPKDKPVPGTLIRREKR
jgi:hypothetical protein